MLENCKSARERWGGVSEIIDRWLEERQELIARFVQLSKISDFDGNNEEHGLKLVRLCEILVDYVSAGHFEVYDQLIQEGREFEDREALEAAARHYKRIDNTTEVALDFNDKYTATDDLAQLSVDLNGLGESLEQRFEAEDQMIDVLHTAHKNLID